MGLLDFLRKGKGGDGGGGEPGRDVPELARRLGMNADELSRCPVAYREFVLPKRGGGTRRIAAPQDPLKRVQRRILRRLLARLPAHPCATGFEQGYSVVSNAVPHARKAVVVRMDVREFFAATTAAKVRRLFVAIGWSGAAADLLVRLTTHKGGLPQGAPTSPRLSNLCNRRLDARLQALAALLGADYTRYADDITISLATDDRTAVHGLIRATKLVLRDEGYELHTRRKLHVRRRHEQQRVTGLVVNDGVRLPRATRRLLRSVEHRVGSGKAPTLTAAQIQGYRSWRSMVESQASAAAAAGAP